MLYLELGVGANTPAIIKYPFWKMTAQNPKAMYAYVNYGEAISPGEIEGQSICINKDISSVLNGLACEQNKKNGEKRVRCNAFSELHRTRFLLSSEYPQVGHAEGLAYEIV